MDDITLVLVRDKNCAHNGYFMDQYGVIHATIHCQTQTTPFGGYTTIALSQITNPYPWEILPSEIVVGQIAHDVKKVDDKNVIMTNSSILEVTKACARNTAAILAICYKRNKLPTINHVSLDLSSFDMAKLIFDSIATSWFGDIEDVESKIVMAHGDNPQDVDFILTPEPKRNSDNVVRKIAFAIPSLSMPNYGILYVDESHCNIANTDNQDTLTLLETSDYVGVTVDIAVKQPCGDTDDAVTATIILERVGNVSEESSIESGECGTTIGIDLNKDPTEQISDALMSILQEVRENPDKYSLITDSLPSDLPIDERLKSEFELWLRHKSPISNQLNLIYAVQTATTETDPEPMMMMIRPNY